MINLQEKIKEIGIDKIRFFVPMSPLHTFFGIISYKSSSDDMYLTECYIDERRYKVNDEYKIELRSIDERFGSETYYQSDLQFLINRDNHIYIKEEGEEIELFWQEEPLTHNLNIKWFGTRIIKTS